MASVGSQTEQEEIVRIANNHTVWLGGRRVDNTENWRWLDGRTWGYQKWASRPSPSDCVITGTSYWFKTTCNDSYFFICSIPQIKVSGDLTFVLRKPFLNHPSFHFWWNHTLGSHKEEEPGFKITWWIENGSIPDTREFVSKKLSGRVSTPNQGSSWILQGEA